MLRAAWIVFRKEWTDALRDRRTLLVVLLSSVAIGPVVLVVLSSLVSGIERRAEAREVMAHGLEHAPTLANYIARANYTVRQAPADFEQRLMDGSLGEPVLVVAEGFEEELAGGRGPLVEVVSSSADRRAETGHRRLLGLLEGYNREQSRLRLAVRGISPVALQAIQVEERDLANSNTRAAVLATMVPYFVLMAVLYGALGAALDSTAGERERGSLEPLLMSPAGPPPLVVGKWAAVAAVGMLIALLGVFSFLPGQWLLRSETLAALFRFGAPEALRFLALLLPLAGAMAAVLMAVAIRCKTFKEAQANCTIVLLVVSMLPLVQIFGQEGERPWHLWVPALGQMVLMGRVLKSEPLGALDVLPTVLVCALLVGAGLAYVARTLRVAAVR